METRVPPARSRTVVRLVRLVSLRVVAERSPEERVAAPRSCEPPVAAAPPSRLPPSRLPALPRWLAPAPAPDGAAESCACASWMLLAAGAGETPAAIPTAVPTPSSIASRRRSRGGWACRHEHPDQGHGLTNPTRE